MIRMCNNFAIKWLFQVNKNQLNRLIILNDLNHQEAIINIMMNYLTTV